MTTLERTNVALYAAGTTAAETIGLLTPFMFKLIAVLWMFGTALSLMGGPLFILFAAIGFVWAFLGFVAAELFVILPLALCAGLVTGAGEFFSERPAPRTIVQRPSLHIAMAPLARIECGAHCPVCATGLTQDVVVCSRCETPHHRDCWNYGGRCAIYGCEA